MRRTATRDILQVNFKTRGGRLFVNYWESLAIAKRRRAKSAGYRAIAGETLAYFHQRILEVHGAETPVLAMGDFNDEPFDPSLVDYALGTRSQTTVVKAEIPRFFNLMWPVLGQALGTHYYDNFPNVLYQFLGNKNLLKENSPIKISERPHRRGSGPFVKSLTALPVSLCGLAHTSRRKPARRVTTRRPLGHDASPALACAGAKPRLSTDRVKLGNVSCRGNGRNGSTCADPSARTRSGDVGIL